MPTFKEVSSSWKARVAIFAFVAVVALVAVSLGVPDAGGCGGAVPSSNPRIAATSNVDSPTIQVDPPEAIESFLKIHDIAASEELGGATRAGSVTPGMVDGRNGTITTRDGQNWSALIPGVTPGDYLVPMTHASQATTYADGGGGGGGTYTDPAPYWPGNNYGIWRSGNADGTTTFYYNPATNGAFYYLYQNDQFLGYTYQPTNITVHELTTTKECWSSFKLVAYNDDFSHAASVTFSFDCTSRGTIYTAANNGLMKLSSVPRTLSGDGFTKWFDEDPAYSAQLMPYLVGCALPAGKSVTFRGATWSGEIGLAPDWTAGRLDRAGEEQITACLLSRVNASGRHVDISLRGNSPALAIPTNVQAIYWANEAAWWGNVFTSPDDKHFCTMTAPGAKGPWFAADRGRVCDASNGFCGGMHDEGVCSRACSSVAADGHWLACAAGGIDNTHAITTFDRAARAQ